MRDYDSILVATDGNPVAETATRYALALAAKFDATVHGVAVVRTEVAGNYPEKRRAATDAVASVADSADEMGIEATTAVLEGGRPYSEIVEYRRDNDLDLVAMGTHGRSGVKRYLLGSVSERVVRSAHVPVLAVPPTETADQRPSFDSILLPIDDHESARHAARHGLAIAEQFSAAIHTLHASDTGGDAEMGASVVETEKPVERIRARITDRGGERDLDVSDHLYSGRPADGIETAIDEYDVDLVAMGIHGKSGIRQLVLGGITEHVLRHVHVPVLATPPADD